MALIDNLAQNEFQGSLSDSDKPQHRQEMVMELENSPTHELSGYEQSREERIKQNIERMQKLGIFDLSLQVKSLKANIKKPINRKTPQSSTPSPFSGPVRRSSRLQNTTPICYTEVPVIPKKGKSLDMDDVLKYEGSRPEFYTDRDEKLLGSTEMSWTLFVDGCGKDGKRIYDPFKGKTCHQCRQKTLGHRTECSKCGMVQGQFCGDCLYMRYGENVLEAQQNPDWICPVCRGICNCSLCRQAKGWPPTGPLYRKISRLGFKSVAHYLVQTKRPPNTSIEESAGKIPASAKRSLLFSHVDVSLPGNDVPKSSIEITDGNPNGKNSTSLSVEPRDDLKDVQTSMPIVLPGAMNGKNGSSSKPSSASNRKRVHLEPITDSIAGRLRQRRCGRNDAIKCG